MIKRVLLATGSLIAVAVLLPPMHDLAGDLFTFHMVQHLLLVLIAAPLIALGSPRLPRAGAVGIWVLHTGAMWAWHLPSAYDAAVGSSLLHGFEHISFLLTAVLFWGFVLRRKEASALHRVGLTFATALQSGALGALLVFASRPLYGSHLGRTGAWGLTALEDQQLAGAIMWIPPGVLYLAVMLVLLYGWFAGLEGRSSVPRPLGGPAR